MNENKISFWKIFWPTLVAVLIAFIVWVMFFFGVVGGIIAVFSGDKDDSFEKKTILKMSLKGVIAENSDAQLDPYSFSIERKTGLSDLLYGLEKAEKDENISGVYVELDGLNCGVSTARELREALIHFQNSGKFVVAYSAGELITLKQFYLTSAIKENYAFPTTRIEFLGLGSQYNYFKNMLDKLGVEMQVIRGRENHFKSAVEPFLFSQMSDSSRFQTQRILNQVWATIRNDISQSIHVDSAKLRDLALNASVNSANEAQKHRFFNKVVYHDEVLEILKGKVKAKTIEDIKFYDFEKYARSNFYKDQSLKAVDKPNVAVILAEGGIDVAGDELSSDNIATYIREARLDKNIKTIVLRVNSPGGSALASDIIWREVYLANKAKTVVVSMGDVAASGGYFIACPASYIFAQPTTITGSIGVFGLIPFTGKFFEDKLGITFDNVSTGPHAVLSTNKKLSPKEIGIIQTEVDVIYNQFLGRVSEGRNLTMSQVHKIARGRVWTGSDAKKIGLVDELGGLKDAINYAAKKKNIKDVRLKYWPLKELDPFEELVDQFESMKKDKKSKMLVSTKLPSYIRKYWSELQRLESYNGIQMRLPIEYTLE